MIPKTIGSGAGSSRRRAPAGTALVLATLALACWPFVVARAGTEEGLVSWYGARFHDRPTASGELFDSRALTMAHPTLPFGTRVKVTNLRNGRSVIVRVNDRGPQVAARIADLSLAAAERLGMLRRGLVRARLEVLPAGGAD